MLSKSELWDLIDGLIRANSDLALYDLELPRGKGTLNVFIKKQIKVNSPESAVAELNVSDKLPDEPIGEKSAGITHDDCTLVSKLLDECPEIEYLRLEAGLVVSSPGINRSLKRSEHYKDAVGERLKISYRDESGIAKTMTGVLKSFENDRLVVEREADAKSEKSQLSVELSLDDINKAQVDFLF